MTEQSAQHESREKIKAALGQLDQEKIDLDGISVVPSQCYHVELDPLHVLFNTNCPASLKDKVNAIISQHRTGENAQAPQ